MRPRVLEAVPIDAWPVVGGVIMNRSSQMPTAVTGPRLVVTVTLIGLAAAVSPPAQALAEYVAAPRVTHHPSRFPVTLPSPSRSRTYPRGGRIPRHWALVSRGVRLDGPSQTRRRMRLTCPRGLGLVTLTVSDRSQLGFFLGDEQDLPFDGRRSVRISVTRAPDAPPADPQGVPTITASSDSEMAVGRHNQWAVT
jgi:hypothetical protein